MDTASQLEGLLGWTSMAGFMRRHYQWQQDIRYSLCLRHIHPNVPHPRIILRMHAPSHVLRSCSSGLVTVVMVAVLCWSMLLPGHDPQGKPFCKPEGDRIHGSCIIICS
ncbi:hypothetical protein GJ744_001626 [Endocarpon pusillum]|uniref:Uncharacterized protein n=1 Tax=Endocarpon pusillum TaxID=364733 RepID=A0A8H7AGU2_9EURO|nr:hypothetical protein GJ744_001626 [Endocarpon pusillum]